MAIELAEHQIRVSPYGECLCADKVAFGICTGSIAYVDNDAVGIAYQLIIIEPGIVAIERSTALHIGSVDDVGPARQVTLLEVVARIVAIPGFDSTFAVDSLLTQVLLGHHQAKTVDGHTGIFGRFEDGARIGRRLGQRVEVVGRTSGKQGRSYGYAENIFQFHIVYVFLSEEG